MQNKKQRNYRAKNTSPDKKAKCNEDQRNYRAFSLSMECTSNNYKISSSCKSRSTLCLYMLGPAMQ